MALIHAEEYSLQILLDCGSSLMKIELVPAHSRVEELQDMLSPLTGRIVSGDIHSIKRTLFHASVHLCSKL